MRNTPLALLLFYMTFSSCVMFEPESSGFQPVVYVAIVDDNSELFVMTEDGSHRKQLTQSVHHEIVADWSPDGTKIAYASWRPSNFYSDSTYFTINTCSDDGSNQERVFNSYGTTFHRLMDLKWSPDGSKLLFTTNIETFYNRGELYTIDSDGSNLVQLTDKDKNDVNAVWAPDGRKILFQTQNDQNEYDFRTIKPDGSGLEELYITVEESELPAYSPDGSKIVFSGERTDDWPGTSLLIADADGTNVQELVSEYGINIQPRFLPDNSGMIFLNTVPGYLSDFYLLDLNTQEYKQLTNSFIDIGRYDISRNGRYITCESENDIYLYDISDNRLKKISDSGIPSFSPRINPVW